MGCGHSRAHNITTITTHTRPVLEKPGTKHESLEENYELLETISSETGWSLLRCVHTPSQKERVLERFDKTEKSTSIMKVYQELDHPSIIRVLDLFEDDRYFYVASDVLGGRNLLSKMSSLIEMDCGVIIFQVLSALEFCHSKGIIHRRVRPETIYFVSEDQMNLEVKLCYFGKSLLLEHARKTSEVYETDIPPPPELEGGEYNEKVDIWDTGVLLYTLLSKKEPEHLDLRALVDNVSMEGVKFINLLLQKEYKARVSAQVALTNPWVINSKSSKLAHVSCKKLLKLQITSIWNFQELIVKYIVTNILDQEQFQRYKGIFEEIDVDKDGEVSYRELTNYYESKKHNKNKQFLKAVERSFSGNLDIYKFVQAAIGNAEIMSKKVLKKAFNLLDEDGDGCVNANEIRKQLDLDEEITDNVWTQIVNDIDVDENVGITFSQFLKIMRVE